MGREEAVYVHDPNLRVKRAKIRNLRIVTPLLGTRSGKATGSALPLYVKRYPPRLARPAELAALQTCSSEIAPGRLGRLPPAQLAHPGRRALRGKRAAGRLRGCHR